MTIATHWLPHDGDGYSEALDYDRLPEPWHEWARIAWSFAFHACFQDFQDTEDLMHNIIVRCAEVAEEYRQRGIPFNKGAVIKTAEYTRLRFYRDKKRWRRVFTVSLNSTTEDEDGYETELIQTILDEKGIDLDTWLDFKSYYQNRPKAERRAIRKLVRENWSKLSGYDWKLIKQFRQAYA
jgi:DNA-directed RNA polymerase specialized sigma24 family protein